ncbi:MAG: hypothetical protein ABI380_08155, partial [Edaphobacter sp.]
LAVCFLHDTRLKFLENGEDRGKGAPMSCSLIYWGERYERFQGVFNNFGAVVAVKNIPLPDTRHNRQLLLRV